MCYAITPLTVGATGVGSPAGLGYVTVVVGLVAPSVHVVVGVSAASATCTSGETVAVLLDIGLPLMHVDCVTGYRVGPITGRPHRRPRAPATLSEVNVVVITSYVRPFDAVTRVPMSATMPSSIAINSPSAKNHGEPEPRPVSTKATVTTGPTGSGSVVTPGPPLNS